MLELGCDSARVVPGLPAARVPERISQGHVQNERWTNFSWPILSLSLSLYIYIYMCVCVYSAN